MWYKCVYCVQAVIVPVGCVTQRLVNVFVHLVWPVPTVTFVCLRRSALILSLAVKTALVILAEFNVIDKTVTSLPDSAGIFRSQLFCTWKRTNIRSEISLPFPVRSNSRWRPAAILENFKWPHLSNALSDPLYVCTQTVLCPRTLIYNDGDSRLIS